MSGIELATAYVSIGPSAENIGSNIASALGGSGIAQAAESIGNDAGDKASKGFGSKWSSGLQTVAVGTAAAVAGIGVAAVALGGKFDDAYDNIRVGTGATGAALDSLKESFRNTLTSVPASFEDTSTAIADVNTRLGLTGPQLEERSAQFLELSRITGTDLAGNIEAATGVLNNFGISSEDQGGKLDILFRASQATGVSVADLSAQMAESGGVLRSVGLDFDDSAALIAGLGKAGVSASDVMPALGKTMAAAAKDGKNASDVLTDLWTGLQGAPDDATAASLAMETLGAKAGPKFAEAIRSGRLNYDDLLGSIQSGSDTILGAGEETADWGEKLQVLGNKLSVTFEPIATRVFNALGSVIDIASAAFSAFFGFAEDHKGVMIAVAAVIGSVLVGALVAYVAVQVAALASTIALAFATNAWLAPLLLIVAGIALLAAGVIYAYNNIDWFRTAVDAAWAAISAAISWAWDNVIKPIWDAIYAFVQDYLIPGILLYVAIYKAAWDVIVAVVQWAWANVIKPIWDALYGFVVNTLIPGAQQWWAVMQTVWGGISAVVQWAWDNVIKPVWDAIYGFVVNYLIPYIQQLWSVWSSVFSGLSSAVQTAWGVISSVWNAIVGGASWVASTVGGFIGSLVDTLTGLPGRVWGALSGMWDFLGDQFRNVINGIVGLWNNLAIPSFTIGGWSTPFGDLPSWTTPRIDFPDLPRLHSGGFVPGSPGSEVLAVLQAGELVLPVADVNPAGSPAATGLGPAVVFEAGAIVYPEADAYAIGEEFAFRTRAARR